jgi:hypothetical protein
VDPEVHDSLLAVDDPAPLWVSSAALQCRIRGLFTSLALHRATSESLQQIAEQLGADYGVVHARFGPQLVSEEWCRSAFTLSESIREQVNSVMMEAAEADQARCVRLTDGADQRAVVAAILYGDGAEQAGSAGFVFSDCDRAHAYEVLVQVESLVGYLALLMTERGRAPAGKGGHMPIPANAGEPLKLLLQLVADISSRNCLDQIAVGVVEGHAVRVALVNNETDIRQVNPGVRAIRDAMGECLDAGMPIVLTTDPSQSVYRLHAMWLTQRGGGSVATIPLEIEGKIVAVVAIAAADPSGIRPETLGAIMRELGSYAALLPVARLATRSLAVHAYDSLRSRWQRIRNKRKGLIAMATVSALAAGWLAFGTLTYRITVPATVRAIDRRIVSCPRDGVLADLYVRPGDQVAAGQILAELDSHDDTLAQADLEAQVLAVDAKIDQALGNHDTASLRVLEAQRNGLLAQRALIARRVEQARVRAAKDSIVLSGELKEKIGARLSMGDAMFELARYDGAEIEIFVPEQQVLDARQVRSAVFLAAASPDVEHSLANVRIAPASRVVNGKNVFVGEAETGSSMAGMPPGMEGYAVIDVGPRPAWWLVSHRILDWLRLNFWV